MNPQKLVDQIKSLWPWSKNLSVQYALLAVFLLAMTWWWTPRSDSTAALAAAPDSIDTFIPQGMTLVPIEVQNHNALDAVVGHFASVDLYTNRPNEVAQRIAKGVRMIRAPKRPNQFAVLVPEAETMRIAGEKFPFYVVIQNPKASGTEFVIQKPKTKKSSRVEVEYFNEN